MNILSLHENRDHRQLADGLTGLISQNARALRATRLGKTFQIGNATFRLYSRGRNTIYRIRCGLDWYLKMPRRLESDAIRREIVGAHACREQLGECPEYKHPAVIRACTTEQFILTSSVPGKMLQRSLYRFAILPAFCRPRKLLAHLRALGRALARLHGAAASDIAPLTRTAEMGLKSAIREATRSDRTRTSVETTLLERNTRDSVPHTETDGFVHGNFKLENVLVSDNGVTIIDFENCGCGSRYEDLALLVSQLFCIGAARHIPQLPVRVACHTFLRGYAEERDFNAGLLGAFVAQRVAEYYVRGFCGNAPRPTVAAIPVSRRSAQRLVEAVLCDPSRIVFSQFPTS